MRTIKVGTKQVRKCYGCGCLFEFENSDITLEGGSIGFVNCPQCSKKISATLVDTSAAVQKTAMGEALEGVETEKLEENG